MRHARQRGIALLVAIVIFAIAATVAAAVTYNKAMAARRAAATFALEQALQAGMAAEALAGIVLNNASSQRTQTNQDWAQPVGPLEIEGTGVWIQAQLEDLQGRFNLNSVVAWNQQLNEFDIDQHQYEIFQRLLQDNNIDLRYADLLVDWIDPDINPRTQGGEDTLYLSQNPPYRPPNTFITHTSELLALPGLGAENFAKIAPHITALPLTAKVNLCTASGIVLDATRNDPQNRTEFALQDLPSLRQKGCYPELSFFQAGTDPNVWPAVQDRVSETSAYFRLRTHIRVGTAEFVLYSVLYRESGTNLVRTIQRSFGSE